MEKCRFCPEYIAETYLCHYNMFYYYYFLTKKRAEREKNVLNTINNEPQGHFEKLNGASMGPVRYVCITCVGGIWPARQQYGVYLRKRYTCVTALFVELSQIPESLANRDIMTRCIDACPSAVWSDRRIFIDIINIWHFTYIVWAYKGQPRDLSSNNPLDGR